MSFLETQNIVKNYSNHRALENVSIQVNEGKIYGLLGPNGAGKSTLIRIINRISVADSGKVIFDGHEMRDDDVRNIGYLPEERGLYKKMKVAEQAIYLAQLRGLSKQDARKRLAYWFDKFDICAWADKKLEELSKGMQQKVQFIITVMHQPRFLIFDEPFSGFDPVNAQLIRNEIMELKKQGSTIMFSTHNMASVEEICDEIGLINQSKLVLQGKVDEIRESHRQGLYQVKVRRPISGENHQALLASQFYQLENFHENDLYWNFSLKKNADCDNVSIFSELSQKFDLISFEESIPNMNDIFIQTVQKLNTHE
ncbi:MAG: ATP-binding cassette domain-containing protein [Bacteroidales bacterium]|nr:ATP-binding cassette domain-containing protein [Bacteroidales bacterium]